MTFEIRTSTGETAVVTPVRGRGGMSGVVRCPPDGTFYASFAELDVLAETAALHPKYNVYGGLATMGILDTVAERLGISPHTANHTIANVKRRIEQHTPSIYPSTQEVIVEAERLGVLSAEIRRTMRERLSTSGLDPTIKNKIRRSNLGQNRPRR